jgi:hypothetical protein
MQFRLGPFLTTIVVVAALATGCGSEPITDNALSSNGALSSETIKPPHSDESVTEPSSSETPQQPIAEPANTLERQVDHIVPMNDFPPLKLGTLVGDSSNGARWVRINTDGTFCVGDDAVGFSGCTVDPTAPQSLMLHIGVTTESSQSVPTLQTLTLFADSSFVGLDVWANEDDLCHADSLQFDGQPTVLAFQCELPIMEVPTTAAVVLTDGSGSKWQLRDPVQLRAAGEFQYGG